MAPKVYIATSREIGEQCKALIQDLSENLNDCEIFISVLYEKLITDEFVRSKKACFNFHPGILPEYRGAGAYSWAILNGEKESGVTLHLIDKDIDHGRIIEIRKFPIEPNDTAEILFRKAEAVILSMFKEWYPRLLSGEYITYEQDETKARIYYRKDLQEEKDLTRYVRAFTFTGKPNAFYLDKKGIKHELLWENQ